MSKTMWGLYSKHYALEIKSWINCMTIKFQTQMATPTPYLPVSIGSIPKCFQELALCSLM